MSTYDQIKSYRRYVEAKVAADEEPVTFSEWREQNGIKPPTDGENNDTQESPSV